MRARSVVRAGTLSCLLFAACDTPGVTLIEPDVTVDDSAIVTFQVHLEDSALAETLGWSNGVPNAFVFIQRVAEPFEPDTLVTDNNGEASYPNFLPGQYKVAAQRILSPGEALITGGGVRAFGDAWNQNINRGQTVPLELTADNAGSIVFSEWYKGGTVDGYMFAHFTELYNNSDSTVYLDGMILGAVWGVVGEIPDLSCAESEPWRNDPLGIWSAGMHKFPGSGRDFPLHPGEAASVARDAVDHSVVYPGLPDLSDADFEFEGTADSDNPDVPNMPYVGLVADPIGHGIHILGTMFLAEALDVETLERRRCFRGNEYARVPTERILDVVRLVSGYNYSFEQMMPPCGLVAPRSLEQLAGGEFYEPWEDLSLALHRRILRMNTRGRFVLQDVNTSFLDFVLGQRNPGEIGN